MYNHLICLLVLYPRKYFVAVFCFFHKQIHQRPIIFLIFTWFMSNTFYDDGNLFYSISKSPNLKKFFSHPFQTTLMHVSYFYCFLNFLFFSFFFFLSKRYWFGLWIWIIFLGINCIKLIVPMVLHMKTNKITHGIKNVPLKQYMQRFLCLLINDAIKILFY